MSVGWSAPRAEAPGEELHPPSERLSPGKLARGRGRSALAREPVQKGRTPSDSVGSSRPLRQGRELRYPSRPLQSNTRGLLQS